MSNLTKSILSVVLIAYCVSTVEAQLAFDREPINYGMADSDDLVAQLQKQLDAGQVKLEYDQQRGYLPSLLNRLDIDDSSQVLVKSKTSFQLRRISPRRPRALYFNDESYVGWVQCGDVIEVMSTDPQQGEIFYTLSQTETSKPRFVRDRGQCIVCHASSRTQGVPGGLVRSMFVDAGGQPHLQTSVTNSCAICSWWTSLSLPRRLQEHQSTPSILEHWDRTTAKGARYAIWI